MAGKLLHLGPSAEIAPGAQPDVEGGAPVHLASPLVGVTPRAIVSAPGAGVLRAHHVVGVPL
jgi:hypothetical protein